MVEKPGKLHKGNEPSYDKCVCQEFGRYIWLPLIIYLIPFQQEKSVPVW